MVPSNDGFPPWQRKLPAEPPPPDCPQQKEPHLLRAKDPHSNGPQEKGWATVVAEPGEAAGLLPAAFPALHQLGNGPSSSWIPSNQPQHQGSSPSAPHAKQGIHPPGQGTGTEPSHPCFNEQGREHKKGKERGDEHIQTQRDALPGRFQALLWKSKQQASDAKQAGPFHQDPPISLHGAPPVQHANTYASFPKILPAPIGLASGDGIGYNRTKFGS